MPSTKRISAVLACCFALLLAGAVLAAPSSAKTDPAPHAPGKTAAKAQPVKPPVAAGVATGSALPVKPRNRAAAAAAPASAWSVGLTASATLLWPYQYSTLTATSNMDVGPTPYYLRIYDLIAGAYVASCGAGTTCAIPVTQTVAVMGSYRAIVSDASSTFPPSVQVASSADVDVNWRTLVDKLNLQLSAQSNTVTIGDQTVVTATTAEDVGPSPFYIQIYDGTTHTLIGLCGFGFSCSVAVSQSTAATHLYSAYVALSVDTFPTGQQSHGTMQTAGFIYVTWANTGWTVTLSASPVVDGSQTLTATANSDVGPTPYFIEIFALPFGHLYGVCGFGNTCAVTIPADYLDYDVEAFVTTYTTAAFPFPASASVQASSNVVNS